MPPVVIRHHSSKSAIPPRERLQPSPLTSPLTSSTSSSHPPLVSPFESPALTAFELWREHLFLTPHLPLHLNLGGNSGSQRISWEPHLYLPISPHISQWLTTNLLGVAPAEAGYTTASVTPHLSLSHPSVNGTVWASTGMLHDASPNILLHLDTSPRLSHILSTPPRISRPYLPIPPYISPYPHTPPGKLHVSASLIGRHSALIHLDSPVCTIGMH